MPEFIVEAESLGELVDGEFCAVQEVVRCENCKYYTKAHTIRFLTIRSYCDIFAGEDMVGKLKPNDFCSRGERKEK